MGDALQPILIERDGPSGEGLAPLTLDPADFQSDVPQQAWHLTHCDEAAGRYVGVWTTTPMQEAFGPYPGDEFMVILEGQVTMIDANGEETLIKAGQAFCVHNATPVSWKQFGECRKFFVISADPDAEVPADGVPEPGVVVFDVENLAGAPSVQSMPVIGASGRHAQLYQNAAATMRAGLFEAPACRASNPALGAHTLVHMVAGSLRVAGQGGEPLALSAGQAVYLPRGAALTWHADAPFTAYYCESNAGGF
jgi:uncharacterized cupin superfamily protein